MASDLILPTDGTRVRSASDLKPWLPLLLLGILWADLIRQLSYLWRTSEQYAYGWMVPILALGLLFRRWVARPAPVAPQRVPVWSTMLAIGIAAVCVPLRIIHEVNPDWPLISWGIGLGIVLISLFAFYLAGGSTWAKHFALPVCFVLVSVQWPYRLEHTLTQGLMRASCSITIEALGWLGVPAVQHGNIIELGNCEVGVQEACSGIRSFQSTVMATLFLGELFQLKWRRRWVLLPIGLGVAFGLNVVRTFILTWKASTGGELAIAKWHDPVGWSIFAVTFFALWALAAALRQATPRTEPEAAVNPPAKLPATFVYALAGWTFMVIAGNELWFRLHESQVPTPIEWSVRLPTATPGFREIKLSKEQNVLLKQDASCSGSWRDDADRNWTVYYLRWGPASVMSRIKARAHWPEVCLPAGGFKLEKDFGIASFKAGPIELPFRRYQFDNPGDKLYVFFCLRADGAEQLPETEMLTYRDRLRDVLIGHRRVGQRSVEIILRGYPSMAAAESAVLERLPSLIRVKPEPRYSQAQARR